MTKKQKARLDELRLKGSNLSSKGVKGFYFMNLPFSERIEYAQLMGIYRASMLEACGVDTKWMYYTPFRAAFW